MSNFFFTDLGFLILVTCSCFLEKWFWSIIFCNLFAFAFASLCCLFWFNFKFWRRNIWHIMTAVGNGQLVASRLLGGDRCCQLLGDWCCQMCCSAIFSTKELNLKSNWFAKIERSICQERGREVVLRGEIDRPVGMDRSVLPYSSDNCESEVKEVRTKPRVL